MKKSEEKRYKENPVLNSLKKENWVLILQTQDLNIDQVNKPYVNLIQDLFA